MSDAPPLTHLEARVLAAIERHVRSQGVAPTIAELATDLRLKSKGTVHRYVQSLIGKGRLERHGNGWRGLRIIGLAMPERPSNVHRLPLRPREESGASRVPSDGSDRVAPPVMAARPSSLGGRIGGRIGGRTGGRIGGRIGERGDKGAGDGASDTGARIPLLGRIAAGMPIEAIEDQRFLDLSGLFAGPERYALRVSGDSMMEAGILDGDTVIVKKQQTARTGDIVVALIDGQEATLKRLGTLRDGMVELVPEHATMQPLRYAASRVSFQGVLIGQLRQY